MEGLKPEDKVLIYSIFDLDDDTFNAGFPIVLEKAYSGSLTMDEYIALIKMQIQARVFDIVLPGEIDNTKVLGAINTRIAKIHNGEIDEPNGHSMISNEGDYKMLPEEKQVYMRIENFRQYEQHYKNRLQYISEMKEEGFNAHDELFRKYYKAFDTEMATVTAAYYSRLTAEKCGFCSSFLHAWRGALYSISLTGDIEASADGFGQLKSSVNANCSDGNITGAIDRLFAKNLDNMIAEYSKRAKEVREMERETEQG